MKTCSHCEWNRHTHICTTPNNWSEHIVFEKETYKDRKGYTERVSAMRQREKPNLPPSILQKKRGGGSIQVKLLCSWRHWTRWSLCNPRWESWPLWYWLLTWNNSEVHCFLVIKGVDAWPKNSQGDLGTMRDVSGHQVKDEEGPHDGINFKQGKWGSVSNRHTAKPGIIRTTKWIGGFTANVLPWLMSLILPANTRILCHWYSSRCWPMLRFLHSWYVGRHRLGQGSSVHSTGHLVCCGMTLRPSSLYGSILLD